ncbi:MAG: glutamine-hydrolyzing carbamoyl-phosphate synthase small subunit [Acidimicrobiia bacterium]
MNTRLPRRSGCLVTSDGAIFEGEVVGALAEHPERVASGEAVFNTALSGYQEIISDPSYAGQIIMFTYPHIGNYGTNPDDDESGVPQCAGVIVRELSELASNWRSATGLPDYLQKHGVACITGVDTRRLTRHIRSAGAVPAAFGADESLVRLTASTALGTDGMDLAHGVSTKAPYRVDTQQPKFSVVAFDFGMKRTIIRQLQLAGCSVDVVPAGTSADDVLARKPDGVFLSNGPGDPAAVKGVQTEVQSLLGTVPIFGICLGHQILSLALGATTEKMPFGHHGGNHPVRNLERNTIEITAQNHNYVVVDESLPTGVVATHRNLNDGTLEGIRHETAGAFSVQHHPEAGPGPHEASYLFAQFTDLMEARR